MRRNYEYLGYFVDIAVFSNRDFDEIWGKLRHYRRNYNSMVRGCNSPTTPLEM